MENIHPRLAHAVITYDRKQSKKRFYNPNALAMYLKAVQDVDSQMERGITLRQAIITSFCRPLLNICLKAVGEEPIRYARGY